MCSTVHTYWKLVWNCNGIFFLKHFLNQKYVCDVVLTLTFTCKDKHLLCQDVTTILAHSKFILKLHFRPPIFTVFPMESFWLSYQWGGIHCGRIVVEGVRPYFQCILSLFGKAKCGKFVMVESFYYFLFFSLSYSSESTSHHMAFMSQCWYKSVLATGNRVQGQRGKRERWRL